VAAAAAALAGADVHLTAGDVRTFPLPPAGLITIIDVLQYLEPADQAALLRRCAEALLPEGRLLFRVPDPADGLLSGATRLLDRVILAAGGTGVRPCHQPAGFYLELMEASGMVAEVRAYRNLLPLRHAIFLASKAAGPR
jgi:trans-aconitate methyltransferase